MMLTNLFRVPKKLLKRAFDGGWELDVATASSQETKTFTGSYGKLQYQAEGLSKAGPLLLTGADDWSPSTEPRSRFGLLPSKDWDRIRYFAPAEMLALQGYPETWFLPHRIPIRTQWRLIGNSINVAVVAPLLRRLLLRIV